LILKNERKEVTIFLGNQGYLKKINLQKDGNKAKPYQVKQVRLLLLKYKLKLRDDE